MYPSARYRLISFLILATAKLPILNEEERARESGDVPFSIQLILAYLTTAIKLLEQDQIQATMMSERDVPVQEPRNGLYFGHEGVKKGREAGGCVKICIAYYSIRAR